MATRIAWLPELHLLTCLKHMTQLTIGSWYRKSSTPHGIALYIELSRIWCQVGYFMSSWTTNVADGGNRRTACPREVFYHQYCLTYIQTTRSFIYADDLCVTALYPSFTDIEETIEDALEEITQYYRSNSLRANPDKTSTEQRGKKIVKSQMEQYRTREHGPAKILRCQSGPHTKQQTAYTQHKDEGGHTQQFSVEIGKLEVGRHNCKHD